MEGDLVRLLFALAAFVLPLLIAWAVVAGGKRRRRAADRGTGRTGGDAGPGRLKGRK